MLLEAALQVAALVTARTRAPDRAARDERAAIDQEGAPILCLGDSFTFGIGASSPEHAYPRSLERRLAAEPGRARRVVNSGWPSCDSREVLAALRRELPRVKPAVVLLLAGINDRWSRPEPLAAAEQADEEGFVWRWRTARLLALLRQRRRADPPAATAPARTAERPHPLVGVWKQADELLAFRPDGTLLAGAERWRWSERDGRLEVVDSAGVVTRSRFRVDGDRLELEPEGRAAVSFIRLAAPPSEPSFSRRFDASVAADDDAGARRVADAWLAAQPEEPAAHVARLRVAVRADDRERIAAELEWLRHRRDAARDEEPARCLAQALALAGRREEALAVAREDVVRFPDAPRLWHALAVNARMAGDFATAERAVDRALELAPGASFEERAEERLLRANIVAERDPGEAAQELVRAFALTRDPALVRRYCVNHDGKLAIERLAAAADSVGVDADVRRELLAAHPASGGAGAEADARVVEVLTGHLVEMVEECRRAGATPWLLSYPRRLADVDAAREAAARKSGAATIDLASRFDELLRELPRDALFIPDGHCTDRGYDEIAASIAKALRERD